MLIITIRTDKPGAELGLYEDQQEITHETWQAHRELAETIHAKISLLLKSKSKDWHDLEGVICFQGPGSFTGLRIGLSVGNALSYSLGIPIVATKNSDWISRGVEMLLGGKGEQIVVPEYGSPVHITPPRA